MSRRVTLSTKPGRRGMTVLAVTGLITVGALVSGCGPESASTGASGAGSDAGVGAGTSSRTSASESTAAADAAAADAAAADAAAADAANAVQTAQNQADAAAAIPFAMPNLVGMDLQSAQNSIQTHGVFYSKSHDLRGSRHQVLDSNWMVCTQNVPAGQQLTPGQSAEGQLDLGVVKRGETCP